MSVTAFDTLGIAGSSLYVQRKWMDAISDNIANVNTVSATNQSAFQERFIVAQAVNYGSGEGGVEVGSAPLGDPAGRLTYQPDHPLADAKGYVRLPDMDLGDQMVNLMIAQRGYQAQLAVIERATTSYQQALQLGKG
ncbi:flagellar basal body rod protein FlgC [Tessaracoccus sp.]